MSEQTVYVTMDEKRNDSAGDNQNHSEENNSTNGTVISEPQQRLNLHEKSDRPSPSDSPEILRAVEAFSSEIIRSLSPKNSAAESEHGSATISPANKYSSPASADRRPASSSSVGGPSLMNSEKPESPSSEPQSPHDPKRTLSPVIDPQRDNEEAFDADYSGLSQSHYVNEAFMNDELNNTRPRSITKTSPAVKSTVGTSQENRESSCQPKRRGWDLVRPVEFIVSRASSPTSFIPSVWSTRQDFIQHESIAQPSATELPGTVSSQQIARFPLEQFDPKTNHPTPPPFSNQRDKSVTTWFHHPLAPRYPHHPTPPYHRPNHHQSEQESASTPPLASNDMSDGKRRFADFKPPPSPTAAPLWKAVCAEYIAVSFMIAIGCASGLNGRQDNQNATLLQQAIGGGIIVTTAMQISSHVSGAHLNPAVTLAFLIGRKIGLVASVLYTIAQCLGAITAAALVRVLVPEEFQGEVCAARLDPGLTPLQGVGVEFLITFVMVLLAFALSDKLLVNQKGKESLIMGITIVSLHLFAIKLTGCGLNPARVLGPALVMQIWDHHWVYWIGELSGSVVASIIYHYILSAPVTKDGEQEDDMTTMLQSLHNGVPMIKEESNDRTHNL